jgi:PAS domain-containing protein
MGLGVGMAASAALPFKGIGCAPPHYMLLAESVEDYAIFMLDPLGYVVTWNTGAERLKGYSKDEVIGSHFSRFYPPDEREAGRPQFFIAQAITHGEPRPRAGECGKMAAILGERCADRRSRPQRLRAWVREDHPRSHRTKAC